MRRPGAVLASSLVLLGCPSAPGGSSGDPPIEEYLDDAVPWYEP